MDIHIPLKNLQERPFLKFLEPIIPKSGTNDPPNSGHPHKTATATPTKVLMENFLICMKN